jgi:hypothetical protein
MSGLTIISGQLQEDFYINCIITVQSTEKEDKFSTCIYKNNVVVWSILKCPIEIEVEKYRGPLRPNYPNSFE